MLREHSLDRNVSGTVPSPRSLFHNQCHPSCVLLVLPSVVRAVDIGLVIGCSFGIPVAPIYLCHPSPLEGP